MNLEVENLNTLREQFLTPMRDKLVKNVSQVTHVPLNLKPEKKHLICGYQSVNAVKPSITS